MDRHMIYNVRLKAYRYKLELGATNIEVATNYFDVAFI